MEDLDLAQIAAYLHITPGQAEKMASRGRIPGRKVRGQWRFNEAEIHHWLEDQIGASEDHEDLQRVERVVKRMSRDSDERGICDLLPVETIEVPLRARTRGSVIRDMCKLVSKSGLMWDDAAMAEAVRSREQMHPTALDSGVALLHPRRPQTSILSDSVLGLAISSAPLPFSDSGHMTDVFFLICSYDDQSHLRILAKLSRLIRSENFLTHLRQCQSPGEAWQCMSDAETELDADD
ncbi:MAG: PTS fructose transporter subunit IIA [Rhodopirellula sp. TMED11]|nr:MAG: PTS fructose transporter subunit IIA [Rhodopirellula sp. TMED11]